MWEWERMFIGKTKKTRKYAPVLCIWQLKHDDVGKRYRYRLCDAVAVRYLFFCSNQRIQKLKNKVPDSHMFMCCHS
jgi:hypothetical protein